jgi:hypothetical protein
MSNIVWHCQVYLHVLSVKGLHPLQRRLHGVWNSLYQKRTVREQQVANKGTSVVPVRMSTGR